MDYTHLFAFVTSFFFVMSLGWYLITNLQWYDYKIERVVFRHHKSRWHVANYHLPSVLQ